MIATHRTYVPAAGHHWALPLYDPLVRLMGGDRARLGLVQQAGIRPGQRVLDVGCGTGTLALQLKRLHPEAAIVGIDPDPKVLARAKRKLERAGLGAQLDQGFADAMPYEDASFDRVLSSFMFHHLGGDEKLGMLREVRRLLKPGGLLYLLDFDGPESGAHGVLGRWLHSSHMLSDNSERRVLALMEQAGLAGASVVARGRMLLGLVAYSTYSSVA